MHSILLLCAAEWFPFYFNVNLPKNINKWKRKQFDTPTTSVVCICIFISKNGGKRPTGNPLTKWEACASTSVITNITICGAALCLANFCHADTQKSITRLILDSHFGQQFLWAAVRCRWSAILMLSSSYKVHFRIAFSLSIDSLGRARSPAARLLSPTRFCGHAIASKPCITAFFNCYEWGVQLRFGNRLLASSLSLSLSLNLSLHRVLFHTRIAKLASSVCGFPFFIAHSTLGPGLINCNRFKLSI